MYICLNRGTTGGALRTEQFVELAASAGFAGADVEPAYGVERGTAALRDLYTRLKMQFGGWSPPLDHRTDPARREEAMKKLIAQAAIAAELKIDSCATWISPSSDRPFLETWATHVATLKPVAAALADHGLRFGLECVSPYPIRRSKKHEFIYTPGLMLELADSIGPNVGLLLDAWHVHHSNTPFSQIAQMPADKIVWVHLSDAPNIPPEQIRDNARLLPGEGIIDLAGYFNALKTAGYKGPVSLETFRAVADLPPAEAAKKAWQACEKVVPMLGEK